MTETKTFKFQTEVGKLLDIVASSMYSNTEIFLRELISNASDACDKLRYKAIEKPQLIKDDAEFKIKISLNKKDKILSVEDNGVGINDKELVETLGTIAKSGTSAFLENAKKNKNDEDMGLIGQFGVGFYSAFMVADKVEVVTKKAGEKQAWKWTSDGKGEFSIEKTEKENRGTCVTLHIKKDAKEFLEEERVKHIVATYSDHIGFPIMLGEETINAASAIWTRPAKEITQEQHNEFYRHSTRAFDEPWMIMHNHAEGVIEYTNLLYIPSAKPFDLYEPERKSQIKLYVNRVFIAEDAKGLFPAYLRFVRGVVDSPDLSLNVSREMLQNDPKLAKIKNGLTKRVISELKKKVEKKPEEYTQFWTNFGAVLKEGLVEDASVRDKLLEICRFDSSEDEKLVSLAEYVSRMKTGQNAIYYITGEDKEKIQNSPHLEGFKAKGIEVLLLSDSVDDFWIQHIPEFDGKIFKSITRGAADLDEIKEDKKNKKDEDKQSKPPALDELIAAIKIELGESVKDVRTSKRLTDSPVCLIADDGDMDVNMERLLKQHGQLKGGAPRVLEINPTHSVIKKLAKRAKDKDAGKDKMLKDAAHLLLDQARIAEGEVPNNPAEFGKRLNTVLAEVL